MGMKPRKPKYDEALAERVRVAFGPRADLVEKKMFGGLCFMIRGHMTVGVEKNRLMVRTGPDNYEAALAHPDAKPMDFTGRPLRGFVYVEVARLETRAKLDHWIEQAMVFNRSVPAK